MSVSWRLTQAGKVKSTCLTFVAIHALHLTNSNSLSFRSLLELSPSPIHSPLISCQLVPFDFMTCDEPYDAQSNSTLTTGQFGCHKFGGQRYEDVEFTSVKCTVLPEIECHGNRTFIQTGIPCIKYSGQYFLTTLLYSIFLGVGGIDRFCLGHVGAAVGKLLTLGGFGIWWIIDIILLISGQLMPEDGSNWVPYA